MNRKLLEEEVAGIFIVKTAILVLEVQLLENATIMREEEYVLTAKKM